MPATEPCPRWNCFISATIFGRITWPWSLRKHLFFVLRKRGFYAVRLYAFSTSFSLDEETENIEGAKNYVAFHD